MHYDNFIKVLPLLLLFLLLSTCITLLDVLVVPHLTENLLSISKLTSDHPIDVLFSDHFFDILNRHTKAILARRKVEHKLYVLEQGTKPFMHVLLST